MILATPFVAGLTDYESYGKALQNKGQLLSHVHLVLNRPQDEEEAIAFTGATSELFARTIRRTVAPEANNTATANSMLREACTALRDHKDAAGEPAGVPMLYSDPTWRPTKIGWLEAIQAEFYAARMPQALGRWKDQGEPGRVVWGPLVVSRSYAATTALMSFLDGRTHWREYLRHELAGMTESSTIGSGAAAVLKPVYKKK